jgi:SAM-dependent methyltransferase
MTADLSSSILNATAPTRGVPLSSRLLKDIIEWDVQTWSRCLELWKPIVHSMDPGVSRVLTVGERNGGLSLWFALEGFRVTCSDFRGPTRQARSLHERHGVASSITYADVNIFSSPYPDSCFDIVAAKSVIGGLRLVRKDPATRTLGNLSLAVAEIHRILKPGGYFLGAENLVGSWLHQRVRSWIQHSNIQWRHLNCAEIDLLFCKFEAVEQMPYGFLGSRFTRFGIDRLTAILDSCVCRFLPRHWKYVCFIKARKGIDLLGTGSKHNDSGKTT